MTQGLITESRGTSLKSHTGRLRGRRPPIHIILPPLTSQLRNIFCGLEYSFGEQRSHCRPNRRRRPLEGARDATKDAFMQQRWKSAGMGLLSTNASNPSSSRCRHRDMSSIERRAGREQSMNQEGPGRVERTQRVEKEQASKKGNRNRNAIPGDEPFLTNRRIRRGGHQPSHVHG